MNKKIYLDYSATTSADKRVLEKMLPYFSENYGNASSIYELGQRSLFVIDESRKKISDFLNCKPEEIIFTGSATESNNLAILGLAKKAKKGTHIITSKIEHDAVLSPCRRLEKEGFSVSYLPVGKDGIIDVSFLEKEIRKDTVLISIMYANNEIGTIQPIARIGEMVSAINRERKGGERIFFHTDAVQAVNYLNCDVASLNVDMLSLSGHKIYGPKGVGALYVRRGTPIEPVIYGGGQEKGLRSGTENTPGIVGLGKAIEIVKERKKDNERIRCLRDGLVESVRAGVENVRINGSLEDRLPNNINFSFIGAEGESIVMALDQKGIYASTGSACSSKSLEPSHVLLALGLSREEAHCSLRITLGKDTEAEDIETLEAVLPEVIRKLRNISGRA